MTARTNIQLAWCTVKKKKNVFSKMRNFSILETVIVINGNEMSNYYEKFLKT